MKSRVHVAARVAIVAFTVSSLLSACSTKDSGVRTSLSDSARNTAGSLEGPTRVDTTKSTAGLPGMPVAQGGKMADAAVASMMDSMQVHLRTMQAMSGAQMRVALPAHRQMVANMLSDLNGEMRTMSMQADASWTALADSVRKDLVQMPDMSATELHSSLPDHAVRVTRLMAMHRTMMARMKM